MTFSSTIIVDASHNGSGKVVINSDTIPAQNDVVHVWITDCKSACARVLEVVSIFEFNPKQVTVHPTALDGSSVTGSDWA